jgi:hypothetical protein
MGYRIREIDAERNFCQELQVDMINRVLPVMLPAKNPI